MAVRSGIPLEKQKYNLFKVTYGSKMVQKNKRSLVIFSTELRYLVEKVYLQTDKKKRVHIVKPIDPYRRRSESKSV